MQALLARRGRSRYPNEMMAVSRVWLARAAVVLALVLGGGLLWDRLHRAPSPARRLCAAVLTAAEAARSQQGLPTTHGEALRQIDAQLAFAREQAATAGGHAAAPAAAVGALELSRGQLTGDYADYARASAAIDRAFAISPVNVGPHLLRAALNMTVHRLAPVPADLARIERYKLPDPGDLASAAGMRGDLLFYRGQYRAALPFYERARARSGGAGVLIRLATWSAKLGDPDRALALLDEAACGVSGPQQQLQGFIAAQRGSIAMDRGDWDAARTAFERSAAIFPGYWSTELQLASVLGLQGQPAPALRLLETIARRDRVPEAFDAIAGLRRAQGDAAGSAHSAAIAGQLWRRRISLFPEAAYAHAVTHFLNFGDPRVALDLAERGYRARPYAPSATVLAAALIANRRPADAVRLLEQVRASGWKSADAEVVAAEAHALLGQGDEADAARRRALAINPHVLDRNEGLTWLEH